MPTKLEAISLAFLLFSEKAASQKDVLDNSKIRLQLNNTFMTVNKQLREVIAASAVEPLVKMQRLCLQFTYDVYNRESDLQSLMLLNKVEEQFRLVQEPDKKKIWPMPCSVFIKCDRVKPWVLILPKKKVWSGKRTAA